RPLSPPRHRRGDDRRCCAGRAGLRPAGGRASVSGRGAGCPAEVTVPAYTRLENDERRSRLLELGASLFTEHAYDEISMSQIARAAGISKALLYHYFPS